MQINEQVAELIREEAESLGLQVVGINQRYEAIDDLITVVYLGMDAPADKIEKLEEAVSGLEGQVIVCPQKR